MIHCCDDHEESDFEEEFRTKTKGLHYMVVKLPRTSSLVQKPAGTAKEPQGTRRKEHDIQESLFEYEPLMQFIRSAVGKVPSPLPS